MELEFPSKQTRPLTSFTQASWSFIVILALAFAVLVSASWYVSEAYISNRKAQLLSRERANTEKEAEVLSTIIEHELSHTINIPEIIADDPGTFSILSRFGPDVKASALPYDERHKMWNNDGELLEFGKKLTHIVSIQTSGVNSCWLMNAAGDTLAIGIMEKDVNFTGANYADRDYFKAAKSGKNGYQFAMGRFANVPALYFVSPVMQSGKFQGAVAVRSNLERLNDLLGQNVFISDEYGVIILSRDANLYMHALPGATVGELPETAREGRYKLKDIPAVNSEQYFNGDDNSILSWRSEHFPSVFAMRSCLNNILHVHVFSRLEEIRDIENDRMRIFAWMCATGFLLIVSISVGVVFFRNNKSHQQVLVRINEQLSMLARTDTLTCCANRRHFLEELAHERQRNMRYGNPFCVMSIDIDHFKQVNDRHGHPVGDQTLCHFVSVVKSMLRPNDLLGRMGGEEFCVLLPQTGLEAASKVAERLRAAVEHSPARVEDVVIPFTVSIGLALWRQDIDKIEDDILNRADNLLYEAKNSGRNAVRVEAAV